MSKLFYPAVFHKKEGKGYWVEFPDLPGCFSDGSDVNETMEHAQEALALYLDQSDIPFEQTIPQPSDIDNVMKNFPNEAVMLVEYDAAKYARLFKTKSVKKTLSIPEWLNDEAIEKGINFSQVLQEALISKLQSS